MFFFLTARMIDSKNFRESPRRQFQDTKKNGWNLSGFSWSHLLHHPKE